MTTNVQTTHDTELLIIDAGPFGLSLATYAGQHGVDYIMVGRPMEFWHKHMPRDMFLRSACDWHLDSGGVSTIARFLELRGQTPADVEPLSLQFYLEYTQWFQEQQRNPHRADLACGSCGTIRQVFPAGEFYAGGASLFSPFFATYYFVTQVTTKRA
jgi:hypothetical protein